MTSDLIRCTARKIRSMLEKRLVSPTELLECLASRVTSIDPLVNALPTLCFERAAQDIKNRDFSQTPLRGLPIVIKDLMAVSGVRTTWGSKIYENHIPVESDLLVDRLEEQGAVVYAKSNTPEFGAGANTFNEVFGITRNPWDTTRSAAGSSGGSAVALATGMAWLATGSDLGGSLRNPASFCGVVGLRPTIGRVPADPGDLAFDRLSVDGPMARNIGDLAMLFDTMVGRDHQEIVGAAGVEEFGKASVECLEAAPVSLRIATMAVEGVKIDEVAEDHPRRGSQNRIQQARGPADPAGRHQSDRLQSRRPTFGIWRHRLHTSCARSRQR